MTEINSLEYQQILQPAWKEHFSSVYLARESQERNIKQFAEFITSHFSCESDYAEFYARCIAQEIPYNTVREEFNKWSAIRNQNHFPSFFSEVFMLNNLPSLSFKTLVTVALGVAAFAFCYFFKSNEREAG
ncbi:MAG: hypothetical protein ACI9S8_002930 [Chlamydiales bacterium]|jgi:hypothetical protein